MVIKCLECNHKCGALFYLAFHYSICHEDKIGKCACGDKTLSSICMKTDCSFKDEFGYSPNSKSNHGIVSSSNPSSSSSIYSSSNPNSSSSSNPNSNYNFNIKVITRCCNSCNYVKPLTDFDRSNFTCRNCTSTKFNCLYSPSIVRYDGMNAHVKRQHPDVDIPKGFTRNLRKCRATSLSSYTDLPNNGVRASLVTPTKTEGLSLIHKVVTPILLLH